jgi:hypothetical protein
VAYLLPLLVLPTIVRMILGGKRTIERRERLHNRYRELAEVDANTAYLHVESMLDQLGRLASWPSPTSEPSPTDRQLRDAAQAIRRYLADGPAAVDDEVVKAELAWDRIQDGMGPRAGLDLKRDVVAAHQDFVAAWRAWWAGH